MLYYNYPRLITLLSGESMRTRRFFLSIFITGFVVFCIGNLFASLCTTLGISVFHQTLWGLIFTLIGLVASLFGKVSDFYDYNPFNTLLFLLLSGIGSFPLFERFEVGNAVTSGMVYPAHILAMLALSLAGCIIASSNIDHVLEYDFNLKQKSTHEMEPPSKNR